MALPGDSGRPRYYVVGLSIRPSVRPFLAFVTELVNMRLWQWMNRFWCKLTQVDYVTFIFGSRSHRASIFIIIIIHAFITRTHSVLNQRHWQSLGGQHGNGVDRLFDKGELADGVWRSRRPLSVRYLVNYPTNFNQTWQAHITVNAHCVAATQI